MGELRKAYSTVKWIIKDLLTLKHCSRFRFGSCKKHCWLLISAELTANTNYLLTNAYYKDLNIKRFHPLLFSYGESAVEISGRGGVLHPTSRQFAKEGSTLASKLKFIFNKPECFEPQLIVCIKLPVLENTAPDLGTRLCSTACQVKMHFNFMWTLVNSIFCSIQSCVLNGFSVQ